jgi:hypothetical protein
MGIEQVALGIAAQQRVMGVLAVDVGQKSATSRNCPRVAAVPLM